MKKIIIEVLLCMICLGCSRQKLHPSELPASIKQLRNLSVYPCPQHADTVRLERQQAYGSTKNVPLGQLTDVAIDSEGRVYIADAKQSNIKVYAPDGHFLTRLGHAGKGPGEFRYISAIQINNHHLFAYDSQQQRDAVFALDPLGYDHTVNLAGNRDQFKALSGAFLGKHYIRNNYTFLIQFIKSTQSKKQKKWSYFHYQGLYYLLNKHGKIISPKLFQVKSHSEIMVPYAGNAARLMGFPVTFYGESLIAISDDNHIYAGWSEHFLIKVYRPDGSYQRAFYYHYKTVPFTRKSVVEAESPKFILKGFNSIQLPETWPALHAMLMDDQDRLWISTIVMNQTVYQWWILNNHGRLLARFTLQRDKSIEEVKNGYLYTKETDKKTGVQQIVRYKIAMQ